MKDERKLRKLVARRVGREIPDVVWDDGDVQDAATEAYNADSESLDLLVEMAQKRTAIFDAGLSARAPVPYGAGEAGQKPKRAGEGTAGKRYDADTFAGEKTLAMAQAMSELFAGLAAQYPGVQDFRSDVLGGQLLTEEEARKFLGVRAGDPSGELFVSLHGAWPGSAPESVSRDLYDLATDLVGMFDWPDATVAAWFVLTGRAPAVRPLKAEFERYEPDADRYGGYSGYYAPPWRIQLTLPPWLPAEEVARAYRLMQEQIVEGKNRLPDEKSLEAARFVWEQQRTQGHGYPPWTLLWKRWNEEHPALPFKSYNDFRRYAVRGAGAVLKLNFTAPDPEKRQSQR